MMTPLVARDLVLGMATFYRTRPRAPSIATTSARRRAGRPRRHQHRQRPPLPPRTRHRGRPCSAACCPSTSPHRPDRGRPPLPARQRRQRGRRRLVRRPAPARRQGRAVIGDVMGHGIAAAAVMGRLSATVRALARLDLHPQLCASWKPSWRLSEPMLATLPVRGLRPGHRPLRSPAPDTRRRRSSARRRRQPAGCPAGRPVGVGGTDFTTTDFTCQPGSILVLTPTGSSKRATATSTNAWPNSPRLLDRAQTVTGRLCDSLIDPSRARPPPTTTSPCSSLASGAFRTADGSGRRRDRGASSGTPCLDGPQPHLSAIQPTCLVAEALVLCTE